MFGLFKRASLWHPWQLCSVLLACLIVELKAASRPCLLSQFDISSFFFSINASCYSRLTAVAMFHWSTVPSFSFHHFFSLFLKFFIMSIMYSMRNTLKLSVSLLSRRWSFDACYATCLFPEDVWSHPFLHFEANLIDVIVQRVRGKAWMSPACLMKIL